MCRSMSNRAKAALSGASDKQTDSSVCRQNGNDQSPADRRLLRTRYQAVKLKIADRRLDADGFDHIFNNVDSLFNEVRRPREQIADAEALYDISSSILDSVKEFKSRHGPTASDLVSSVLRNFGSNVGCSDDSTNVAVEWERLGQEACRVFSDAPGLGTMMGPMDSQKKLRKTPVKRPRDKPSETARPEELRNSTDNETLTDKNMESMFRILRQLRLVSLEELVLNRQSLAQTIENIFALSFLVKDGRAEISVRDGRHLVGPKNFPSQQQRELGNSSMSQFVFRFDFKDWQVMKAMVEEGREKMPHRDKHVNS